MGGKSRVKKGKVRKDNDRVDLKPLPSGRSAGGDGAGRNTGLECPIAFEISLPEAGALASGTRLLLHQRGDTWFVIANAKQLATVRKDRSTMLTECLESGYRYSGDLRARGNRKYGAFQRTS